MRKRMLFGLAVLPVFAGVASAADLLNDGQMDRVAAGAAPGIYCPTCIVSSSTSISENGITVTTSTTTQPTSGGTSGGDGAGSGGTGGGGTGGGGTSSGGTNGGGPVGVTLPSNFVTNMVRFAGFNPVSP